jgi:hypothetical protein
MVSDLQNLLLITHYTIDRQTGLYLNLNWVTGKLVNWLTNTIGQSDNRLIGKLVNC